MSRWLVSLRIAWLSLLEHRRRNLLVGSAIAGVTSLFVLLSALATGAQHTLIDAATTLSTGHLNVGGFFKLTSSRAAPMLTDYRRVLEVVQRELPELESTVVRGRGWGRLISDHGSLQTAIWGIDIATEPALRRGLDLAAGSLDALAQPDAILMFERQARKLGVVPGDTVTISSETARGVANTIDLRVVAVARDVGPLSAVQVYISSAALRTLYQLGSDVTGVIQLRVGQRYVEKLAPLATQLRAALVRAGYQTLEPDPRAFFLKLQSVTRESWQGQKLDVTTWQDELSFMMWTFRARLAASALLVFILQAITIAGVMNTMWIAVRERTRELGTLRALGVQRRGIVQLLLLEAGMLGLLSAAAGIVIGGLTSWLLNALELRVPSAAQVFLMRDTLLLELEPRILLAALLSIGELTATAALLPALFAARRRPLDAMAHFG